MIPTDYSFTTVNENTRWYVALNEELLAARPFNADDTHADMLAWLAEVDASFQARLPGPQTLAFVTADYKPCDNVTGRDCKHNRVLIAVFADWDDPDATRWLLQNS